MTKKDALSIYTLTAAIHDGFYDEKEVVDLMYIYQGIGLLHGLTETRVKHEYAIRNKLTQKETFVNLLESLEN